MLPGEQKSLMKLTIPTYTVLAHNSKFFYLIYAQCLPVTQKEAKWSRSRQRPNPGGWCQNFGINNRCGSLYITNVTTVFRKNVIIFSYTKAYSSKNYTEKWLQFNSIFIILHNYHYTLSHKLILLMKSMILSLPKCLQETSTSKISLKFTHSFASNSARRQTTQ